MFYWVEEPDGTTTTTISGRFVNAILIVGGLPKEYMCMVKVYDNETGKQVFYWNRRGLRKRQQAKAAAKAFAFAATARELDPKDIVVEEVFDKPRGGHSYFLRSRGYKIKAWAVAYDKNDRIESEMEWGK